MSSIMVRIVAALFVYICMNSDTPLTNVCCNIHRYSDVKFYVCICFMFNICHLYVT